METITNIKNPKGKIKILEVNFNLKSKKDSNKKVLILAVFRHKGEKLVYSTRHKIEPKYWEDKKQKPKISYPLYKSINNDLEQIKNHITEIINSNHEIAISDLKMQLDIKLNRIIEPEQNHQINFIHCFQDHIKKMIQIEYDHKYNYRTIQKFKTVLRNLFKYKGYNIEFSEILNYKDIEFPFDEIDLEFKEKYMKFRYEFTGAKSQNTLNTEIVIISKILETSYIEKLHQNTIFQNEKFKISRVDTSKLALTEEDLELLSNFDFSFNKRMERVIDWFLISCYTALRWSDFSKIEPEHIIKDEEEYYLRKLTYKTSTDVYIPIDHKFLNLIKNMIIKVLTLQTRNLTEF
ncbi:MAG: hypothetical protein IPH57_17420 [Saprospiraceae bacterium]|nr:hypothetical protein [Saprospiraceae bacterium]